jgi:hypothetical protein
MIGTASVQYDGGFRLEYLPMKTVEAERFARPYYSTPTFPFAASRSRAELYPIPPLNTVTTS